MTNLPFCKSVSLITKIQNWCMSNTNRFEKLMASVIQISNLLSPETRATNSTLWSFNQIPLSWKTLCVPHCVPLCALLLK